ncbi:MAG: FMN-binding protein [bacterium]
MEVDAISGATFTSQGIIDAVNDALQEFAVAAGDTGVNMADIADGTYTGSALGFNGQVEVEVTVAGGVITSVKVLRHNESPGVSDPAIQQVPERIVKEQRLDVDAVSGATFSSHGIMDAVEAALTGAAQ